jgi:hypothetical protein
MNTGLTIAFICNGDKHPTVINYKLFGNKYWDDTQNNKSKIGYYFAYYFQQKYVYIHKIINILQPSEQPSDMIWESNRQILCLSKQLKKFTWDEWITGIGRGAPYTPKYCMTQTGSWSYNELQNHVKYNTFNFINFKNIIDQQPANIAINYVEDAIVEDAIVEEDDEEAELMREMEIERKAMEERMVKRLKEIKDKQIVGLREKKCHELKIQLSRYQDMIDELNVNQYKIEKEIKAIMIGDQDAELIKQKDYIVKLTIEF